MRTYYSITFENISVIHSTNGRLQQVMVQLNVLKKLRFAIFVNKV